MSNDLGQRLHRLTEDTRDRSDWQPTHFDLTVDRDRSALAGLLASPQVHTIRDTIADQCAP
ncbi:hypothetical protein [Nocardia vinacea]|uniref:hypothetical protein n=1 Tax=Nocardia vinacea TaxID=96468 RepID=UPI0002ED1FCD|nr:hypothetical protein [Nocardia vinacea]